ncbi:MAG: TlyA family RNA methyltransferase [Eubacteriales bacterium]|nr:TlyA family RNA methyltransferase [Eubacteriales bacterium]MDD4389449.1 TlyA family RNA methyltransferase [Eubacteriales bacterium]
MKKVLKKGFDNLLKDRLDIILVKKGFFQSRERAKAAIMAGIVYVDGQKSDKAGTAVSEDSEFFIKENLCPYVSRGGLKLEKAINEFNIELNEAICMDIGASTGGFTDCMLQRGAQKVYAVDVGYGQLDYKLRIDPRIVNMEKVNIRYLDADAIKEDLDFISIDVSFISLKLVLPVAASLLRENGSILCLVKPQFEAGKEQVGKKGIVREPEIHKEVIENVVGYAAASGLYPAGLTFSPIKGAKGNIEYLLLLKKQKSESFDAEASFTSTHIIALAHSALINN